MSEAANLKKTINDINQNIHELSIYKNNQVKTVTEARKISTKPKGSTANAKEPPAEEAPAEKAPAEEAPAKEAPAKEAPADEAPAQEPNAKEPINKKLQSPNSAGEVALNVGKNALSIAGNAVAGKGVAGKVVLGATGLGAPGKAALGAAVNVGKAALEETNSKQ